MKIQTMIRHLVEPPLDSTLVSKGLVDFEVKEVDPSFKHP